METQPTNSAKQMDSLMHSDVPFLRLIDLEVTWSAFYIATKLQECSEKFVETSAFSAA